MSDIRELLQRQARWQQSRQALSWPEKICLAEQMREAIQTWRAQRTAPSGETPIAPQLRASKALVVRVRRRNP